MWEPSCLRASQSNDIPPPIAVPSQIQAFDLEALQELNQRNPRGLDRPQSIELGSVDDRNCPLSGRRDIFPAVVMGAPHDLAEIRLSLFQLPCRGEAAPGRCPRVTSFRRLLRRVGLILFMSDRTRPHSRRRLILWMLERVRLLFSGHGNALLAGCSDDILFARRSPVWIRTARSKPSSQSAALRHPQRRHLSHRLRVAARPRPHRPRARLRADEPRADLRRRPDAARSAADKPLRL